MINTAMNTDIQRMVNDGSTEAAKRGKPILVSSVTLIDKTDPFAFYKMGETTFNGNRVFWADYKREVIFVGLGRALSLQPEQSEDRFQVIDEKWRELIADAIVTDAAPDHAGPVMFGGYTFDPRKEQTELWHNFPHTLFVVPQYMLTVTAEETWLTVNQVVHPQSTPENIEMNILDQLNTVHDSNSVLAKVMHTEEIAPSSWMENVERVTRSIRSGELDKVVLARQMRLYADDKFNATAVLEQLFKQQQDSYIFSFEQGDDCFIGATPERLIKRSGDSFLSTCLAGSIARGDDADQDQTLGITLLTDDKNRLEHDLAVQMITDAMNEICVSLDVLDHPVLYKLKDIQHLYTPVAGLAKEGATLLHGVEALHPTPALGGFPPQQAVRMIREVEQLDRGWYAAPIGWINRHQDGEFAVAIRSALIQGNEASLFAGCGIMGDSDPLSEYHETALKFRPMLAAFGALNDEEDE